MLPCLEDITAIVPRSTTRSWSDSMTFSGASAFVLITSLKVASSISATGTLWSEMPALTIRTSRRSSASRSQRADLRRPSHVEPFHAEPSGHPGGHRLQLRGHRRRADRADDGPAASEILRGQPATNAARDPDDQDRVTAIGRTEFRLHVVALRESLSRFQGSRCFGPCRRPPQIRRGAYRVWPQFFVARRSQGPPNVAEIPIPLPHRSPRRRGRGLPETCQEKRSSSSF